MKTGSKAALVVELHQKLGRTRELLVQTAINAKLVHWPGNAGFEFATVHDEMAVCGHALDYRRIMGEIEQEKALFCHACRGEGKVLGDCELSPNVWFDDCTVCEGTGARR